MIFNVKLNCTSGLYLLVRSSPILEYSSTALLVITLVGASTAFFAATCGLVQNDLKRIIAFSTISQLGYILTKILLFLIFFYILYITLNKIFYLEPFLIHSDYYLLASFFIKPALLRKRGRTFIKKTLLDV